MAVRFLHSADWQIGKQFGYVSDGDVESDDKAALLRTQRLRTVEKIAQQASEREVDAVVVAGDVFETNAVSDESLRRTVHALSGYRGPWLLLPGNHDAALVESVWTRLERLGLPDNVRLLTRAEPQLVAEHRLAILPAPLTRRHEASDLTASLDAMESPPGAVRIGVAHGSVKTVLPAGIAVMNEIANDRAERARLDYLALGDWHGTLRITDRTWYAGTPEPDGWKDNSPGNVLEVTIDGPGARPRVETIAVGHFHWHQLDALVHQREDLAALDAQLASLGAPFGRHLVTLKLKGSLDVEAKERLDGLLADWRARLHVLRVDDSQLLATPSDADLDALGSSGFLRLAVERLRNIENDPRNPQSEHARRALQLLHHTHARARAGALR